MIQNCNTYKTTFSDCGYYLENGVRSILNYGIQNINIQKDYGTVP